MGRHMRQREVSEMAARGRKMTFLLDPSSSSVQLKTHHFAETASPEDSTSPASSGSSELAKESPKFADLKENAVNVEEYIATSSGDSVDFSDRREQMTPSSEVQIESGELESTARPPESNPRRREKKMPTEDELEDFFAAAEINLQKQFINKYNFDIVKDEPLEGRYEWVPVQLKL